jgi:hypothetical protein
MYDKVMKAENIFKNEEVIKTRTLYTPYGEVECRACEGYKGWIAYLFIEEKEYRGYGRTPEQAYSMAVDEIKEENNE